MRYAVLDGGKRVRPLLVYAAGDVTEAEGEALDRAALAVEFVRTTHWCTTTCHAWTTTSCAGVNPLFT